MPRYPELIFIHSSFRTSSTWLWQKFRTQQDTLCFYEPHNEFLLHADAETMLSRTPENWASGHPGSAPYFAEYMPLLSEGGIVQGMDPTIPYASYVSPEGPLADITDVNQNYLSLLVDHARSCNKRAVIGCTRSIGRVAGIRRALGGTHIFMYRPLLSQWLSYVEQHDKGESYFLDSMGRIVVQSSGHNPFMAALKDRYWIGRDTENNFMGFRDHREAETVFLLIHLYFYAYSKMSADFSISTRRLGQSRIYNLFCSSYLSFKSRNRIELSDFRERIHDGYADAGAHIKDVRDLLAHHLPPKADHRFIGSLIAEYESDLDTLRSVIGAEKKRGFA